MHRLKSFGGLTLADDSGQMASLPRRRLALLALVAAGGGRGMSRERVVALLWPDNAPESGRHSLDQLLSLTRRQLGDDVFIGSDPLRLNPEIVASDIAGFEAALAASDPANAVGRYAGPFLDGFYLNDAAEFERWSESERARLGQLYRDALIRLAREDSARGDPAAAVGRWRRYVVSDPLGSQGAVGLMRALVAAGDRPGAMQHARVYDALVRQEFDMAPDPSITAFVEQLRHEPPSRPAVPPVPPAPNAVPTQPAAAGHEASLVQSIDAAGRLSLDTDRWRRRHRLAWVAVPVILSGMLVWNLAGRAAPTRSCSGLARSVAVLPFANISANPDDEYLTEGLTEELIADLEGISGVQVAPRSSSFYYKATDLPSREIGHRLKVDCVVEGSLRREGNQIRVNVQLVDVMSGFSTWSEVYDQHQTSALALQAQVARSIADSVRRRVSRARLQPLRLRQTTGDSAAYDLYLQGRYFWNRRTDPSLVRAIEKFNAALARDSMFALAWAGLADCYSLQTIWGTLAPKDAFPLAKHAAQRALALDSTRAEVHTALGIISMFYDWNWPDAKHHFEQAIAIDPDYAAAHQFYAWYLEAQDRPDDALQEMQRAATLEPLSVIITTRLGSLLARHGALTAAIAPLHRAIQLDSTDANPRFDVAFVYSALGRHDSALANLPPLGLHLGNYEGGAQVYVLARAGRMIEARRTLAEMVALQRTRYVSGEALAVAYAGLGDRERAFAELRRAVTDHSFLLSLANHVLPFESLRADPRFGAILATVGVP